MKKSVVSRCSTLQRDILSKDPIIVWHNGDSLGCRRNVVAGNVVVRVYGAWEFMKRVGPVIQPIGRTIFWEMNAGQEDAETEIM
jgi:hypothetical protein